MSILCANLKHLYQKRSFWPLGLFFGIVAFGIAMVINEAITENKQGAFCAPALWVFFAGSFIATLSIEVLTKPFSYCLPGHKDILRKFLFFMGLPLSILWSLSYLFFPDLNFAKTVLACLSAFSAFTIFYWLGVWFVFRFRSWFFIFALFPLLLLGDKPLHMSVFIVYSIVESPLRMILLGVLVNFLAWFYWGRPNLARHYCGKLWMGAFDAWNKKKIEKLQWAKLAEQDRKKPGSKQISAGAESFFVSRISGAETGSLQQYIWGCLYKSFGLTVSQRKQDWMRFLILIVPMLCFVCYMPGRGKNIIFFMPGIIVALMSLNVHSSLLISGGRRERFWSALTLAVTTSILITFLVTFLAALTMPLELILPELTIKGVTFVFHALSIKLFFMPLLMIPVTLAIGLIFHKKLILAMFLAIVYFQILFFFNIVKDLTIMNVPVRIGPVHIMIMLLCSWTFFVAVSHHVCIRRCLAGQGR